MLEKFNIRALYGALKNQDPSKDIEFKKKIYKMHETFVEFADEKGPFFLGQNFSIAEVLVSPFYDRFSRLLRHYRDFDYIPCAEEDETYPWDARMRTWAKAVEERQSFKETSQGDAYIQHYSGYAGERGAVNTKQVVLYSNPICPFAQRAWLAVKEKQVSHEFKLIPLSGELSKAEEDFDAFKGKSANWVKVDIDLAGLKKIKEDYKKNINAGGTVPTIQHGENIILESAYCAYYLDEAWPDQGNKLCPDDSYSRYKVRYMLEKFNIGALYGALKNQDPSKDIEFKKKIYKMHETFVEFADEKGPFFLGQNFSIAEVLVAPFYDRFSRLLRHYRDFDYIPFAEEDETYPWAVRMRTWAKAVKERQSFKETSQGDAYIQHYSGYAGERGAVNSKQVVLYSNPICPFAQRAWLAVKEKQVSYEFKLIPLNGELSKAEEDFDGFKGKSANWGKVDIDLAGLKKIKEIYKKNINAG